MTIDFRAIRSFNNSKNLGFEELCCQLAHAEEYSANARFIRRGAPDQGIECLWTQVDGTIHAWQAKYFFELGKSQWANLDSSVKAALDAHCKLTRYTTCIPIDRSTDANGKTWSQMRHWNARVEKWTAWASQRGMQVEFTFWGSHELTLRLARDEQAGRRYYWFREQELCTSWFQKHIQEIERRAGPRYSDALNIKTQVVQALDAVARTPRFIEWLRSRFHDVRAQWLRGYWDKASPKAIKHLNSCIDALRKSLDSISSRLGDLESSCREPVPLEHLVAESRAAARYTIEATGCFPPKSVGSKSSQTDEMTAHAQSALRELSHALDDFSDQLDSSTLRTVNRPYLFLTGDAGKGKTHSLVDFAIELIASGSPVVFLFGHSFTTGSLWQQMVELLGLVCTRDEFLGALDAAAEAAGRRGMVIIDAVNEGEARHLWRDELPPIVEVLKRFPNLGMIVSCRSNYRPLVEREDLIPKYMHQVDHPGLAGVEFSAAEKFFAYYGCELPKVPLLLPEFENPLFLKIFCIAVAGKGQTMSRIPGFNGVFQAFLDAVNVTLASPDRMDYLPGSRLVHKAVEALADAVGLGRKIIPIVEAERMCQNISASSGYANSLLANLISEGVLWQDRVFTKNGNHEEIVTFSYERFSDHAIADRLISTATASEGVQSIDEHSQLAALLRSSDQVRSHAGVVSALAVLLPERQMIELTDFVTDAHIAASPFLDGIPWRSHASITDRTRAILDGLLADREHKDQALESLVQVATIPGHPLNADALDAKLRPLSMAERDAMCRPFFPAASMREVR